jgi:hypothetical protein
LKVQESKGKIAAPKRDGPRVGTSPYLYPTCELRARLAVEVGGTLFRGTYRYTRVWAREGGGPWRVVAGHVSEIPLAGGGPAAG